MFSSIGNTKNPIFEKTVRFHYFGLRSHFLNRQHRPFNHGRIHMLSEIVQVLFEIPLDFWVMSQKFLNL